MVHVLLPILLADLVEVLVSVAGLFGLLMWVIRQIVEANKQIGPQRGKPPAAAAQPQPQGGINPAGQQADPLRKQVEEFLRRSGRGQQAKMPAKEQRRVRPNGGREIEVLVADNEASSERRPLAQPLRPTEPPAPSPIAQRASMRTPTPQRQQAPPRRETVAEHVAESVAAHTRAIGEQASRLGQRIIQDDHQFDVQLRAKFDHSVGTLTNNSIAVAEQVAAAAATEPTPATQIAAMLANPDGVRQAIVLNEILRPPSDRW
jgi:hypothetical protein